MAVLSSASAPFFPRLQLTDSPTHFPAICLLKSAKSNNSHLPALPTFRSRSGKYVSLHERRTLTVAFASESSSPDKDAVEEKTDGASQGPPFLTILAGLVVFLFICWIVASVVTWLIGLILKPPS